MDILQISPANQKPLTFGHDGAKLGDNSKGEYLSLDKELAPPLHSASLPTTQDGDVENVPDTHENRLQIEATLDLLSKTVPNIRANSRYRLEINSENNKLQINVVNSQTGEVIEQIPSRRLMNFYGMLEELNGLVFEKHA